MAVSHYSVREKRMSCVDSADGMDGTIHVNPGHRSTPLTPGPQGVSQFASLPLEIIVNILSYLSVDEIVMILNRCGPVLSDTINYPMLWTYVNFCQSNDDLDLSVFLGVNKNAHFIVYIRF